jgi:hypothetical protein
MERTLLHLAEHSFNFAYAVSERRFAVLIGAAQPTATSRKESCRFPSMQITRIFTQGCIYDSP